MQALGCLAEHGRRAQAAPPICVKHAPLPLFADVRHIAEADDDVGAETVVTTMRVDPWPWAGRAQPLH